jgi:hypothetical protein
MGAHGFLFDINLGTVSSSKNIEFQRNHAFTRGGTGFSETASGSFGVKSRFGGGKATAVPGAVSGGMYHPYARDLVEFRPLPMIKSKAKPG